MIENLEKFKERALRDLEETQAEMKRLRNRDAPQKKIMYPGVRRSRDAKQQHLQT